MIQIPIAIWHISPTIILEVKIVTIVPSLIPKKHHIFYF